MHAHFITRHIALSSADTIINTSQYEQLMTSVGIIGTGFGTKVHLPALQAHQDFEVISIAGRNPEKTATIAKEAGINHTTQWKDLLEDSSIDLITVTTPPYLHYEMAKKVLKSGKHLLLEKPTTTKALEARELLTLALDNNLIGMLCHEFRWIPTRALLAKLVLTDQFVGEIREVHFNQFYSFAASSETPLFNWLWDSTFDGGMFGAAGSHLVDQIRSTTGKEIKEVQGTISTRTKNRKNSEGEYRKVTADDGFTVDFKLVGGVRGVLNISSTLDPAPPGSFVIGGNQGTAYLSGNKVYAAKTGSEFQEISIPEELLIDETLASKDYRIPPFMKLLDRVSYGLRIGTSPTPNLEDGWRNQQVLDATRKSFQLGSRVKIVDYL
ncbi:MAG: Gfo/Idh/MocA family protein [Candidatus Kariarchaeaceae archaeon]